MAISADPAPIIPDRTQPLVAAATAACLLAAGGWMLAAGGFSGGLVDHDRPPPSTTSLAIDVNEATAVELAQLPGLGPATARRLVDHRRDHGNFASIESLLDVPGIGAATLEQMRPHLRPLPADRSPLPARVSQDGPDAEATP